MPLDRYRKKRDFAATPEPAGSVGTATAPATAIPPTRAPRKTRALGTGRFVVQRHRATRLHYDFRLEIDGVLVSWAVPKGPTLDPSVRRMAVHVEDHPLEYFDFEGVIPSREYGGGDVIVWDKGTWEPAKTEDPGRAVADGERHADLHGDKLRGRFVLIRRGSKERPGDSEEWMLLHKRDEHAVEGWDPEDHPRSVLTGRTN